MNLVTLQEKIYGGSVESRLAFGRLLYKDLGTTFSEISGADAILTRMRGEEIALSSHMNTLNLGRLCSLCASSPGGGCCSRYMAAETDSLQILMNLLAGVHIVQVNDNPTECCYLGDKGCLYIFKPMFCLNYNCLKIKELGDSIGFAKLERLAAALLRSQYELETLLFRFLLRGGPGSLDRIGA